MKLHLVGYSHHKTPLDLREQLSFTEDQIRDALQTLRNRFPHCESVILSTCNRMEIYIAGNNPATVPSHDDIIAFIGSYHSIDVDVLKQHAVMETDRKAILHLFSVTSSLDSLVLGETQILSQVKQAYDLARQYDHAGPLIHRLFQHASFVAKRVTTETEIHRKRVSVPSVAVSEIATEFFERLSDKQVVVIGSGEMGEETLRYLLDAGARRITLINRSRDRAERLSQQYGGEVANWDALESVLGEADLVVSTTGATEPIVTLDRFRAILAKRRKGAMLILDLAVPRDFDPVIGELPEVYLYSVDDLQQVCQNNVVWREQQLPKAFRIVEEEADKFLAGTQHRSTIPTIQALRQQAADIKAAEWTRLKGRLANHQVSPEAEEEISQALDRLINKLLHPPMQSLRDEIHSSDHATLLDALKRLFQLKD
ncbi:MAG: glutamyl-tRNA reductase [Pirellulales bacterium]